MKAGQTLTDFSGSVQSHYLGAAGEHLVASFFLAEGTPVFFPVAQAGWVDLVIQTPHGFKRVQVKTTSATGGRLRVRHLGSSKGLIPSDRYDLLAVINKHRLWVIPASLLGSRDDLTLNPHKTDCPWNGHRRR